MASGSALAAAPPQGTTEVLGGQTVWRYHAVLRAPAVGTARKLAGDQAVGENWILRNSDFTSKPPEADWMKAAADDSRWAFQEGALYGGYGGEQPVGVAMLCARGRFLAGDAAQVKGLKLSLAYRGGVVVYLNGEEVARQHLPKGKLDPRSLADDYPPDAFVSSDGLALLPDYGKAAPPASVRDRYEARIRKLVVDLPAGLLQNGVNVLAVGVHRTAIPGNLPQEGRGAWDTAGLVSASLTAASPAGLVLRTGTEEAVQVFVLDPWLVADGRTRAPDLASGPGRVVAAAPRNGLAAAQVVVRAPAGLRGLKAVASDLAGADGKPLPAPGVRYVHLGADRTPLLDGPVDGAIVQPIWLTFQVPTDAAPGKYSGTLALTGIGKAVTLPVELTVHGWRVGSPREWKGVVNMLQSPESVAGYYKVPMWSDEHFRLIEHSFRLMALVGNNVLGVQAVARSYLGDDPVIVFRREGGKYVPEFKFFDRYVGLYDRIVGKPLLFSVQVWTWPARGEVETGRQSVVVKELRGGELVTVELPPFGDPGTEELWRATLEGVRERVKKLGWREDGILLGTGGDSIPLPATVEFFNKVAPWAEWRTLTHGCGCPKWGLSRAKRMQPNGMVTGYLEIARWIGSSRQAVPNHPVTSNSRDHVAEQSPYAMFALAGFSVRGGYEGFCWKGLDYWPHVTAGGKRVAVLNHYMTFGNVIGSTPRAIAAPGPHGAVANGPFEMLREGVQVCEAVLEVRRDLKKLFPPPVERCDVAEMFLGKALRRHTQSGKDTELEVTLVFRGDQIIVRPYAPSWNTGGIGKGTAKCTRTGKKMKFEVDVTLNDDAWVPGGSGSFVVETELEGEDLKGTFRGKFRDLESSGEAVGSFRPKQYEVVLGPPAGKTELWDRANTAVETFLTAVNLDNRGQRRQDLRELVADVYKAATETSRAAAAKAAGP
jgi:hypothetical protein